MSIITLTTDYGLKDHFVGSLKGKLLSEYNQSIIIDISHNIDPFNISEACYIINAAYSNFPKGTVHLIGVDIERNRETQHLAIQWNDHYFICADNGILSILTHKIMPQKMVAINIHDRLLPDASDLDLFTKVACHLAKGGLLNVIGKEIQELKVVTEMQPIISTDTNSILGYVVYFDHFGNAVTNISKKIFLEIANNRPYEIKFRNKQIKTIFAKYSDIGISENYPIKNYEGQKLAIFNEAGYLEIAIFKSNPSQIGSANSLLGLKYRDSVSIEFKN